jgi:hypothetical protein
MHHVIICPYLIKKYTNQVDNWLLTCYKKWVETILFKVSDGCTMTKELENVNVIYYRFIHINHSNDNFNHILNEHRNLCHYSVIRGNKLCPGI